MTQSQGDPRLILTANGSSLQFIGGAPLMDRGLENLALISLFTRPGWAGNQFIGTAIGSDFEDAADQPVTRQSLRAIEDAAEKALDDELFGSVVVTVRNPTGDRLEVNIVIGRGTLQLSREGGVWEFQTLEPAHRGII